MLGRLLSCGLGVCLFTVVSGPEKAQNVPKADTKAPWGALVSATRAGEIVLQDVCLPAIAEGRSLEELASTQRLVPMPPRAAKVGPNDRVWRMGSLRGVYAVGWADGACTTFVDQGNSPELSQMAEGVILARPEGFTRGRTEVVNAGKVQRTIFCARTPSGRIVASIATPVGQVERGTRALASTVYRADGWSNLCELERAS